MPDFLPGLELAGRFYREVVRPILDAEFAGLEHTAGLIGSGSEVLGFDTPVSADHHWGPRVILFLREEDHAQRAEVVREALSLKLPHSFLGWPTNFAEPVPSDPGTRLLRASTSGPVNHLIEVLTSRGFLVEYLGFDLRGELEPRQWLTFPSQKLRTITAGALFHDGLGFEEVRRRLAWYPHDVWLYLLASGWARIGQEEHLMGRAGQVGDEIGSIVIAARLVRDLMRLCFLMECVYAPYPKWYGTAFARLRVAGPLSPLLEQALRGETWRDRDRALGDAYGMVAQMHNALGISDPMPESAEPFFKRPFAVIFGDRFAASIRSRIEDERVRRIPLLIGGIDQWSDSTDLLEAADMRTRLETLYRAGER